MKTLKAGCFLVNKESKTIVLVYREKQKDYSFPKGHLEKGETLQMCAVRETEEETKRTAQIVERYEPFIDKYVTPQGEQCMCYMYIALDKGSSDNTSQDTHRIHNIPIEEVEERLSYQNLKDMWSAVKGNIKTLFNV